jgi:hypothetical protein
MQMALAVTGKARIFSFPLVDLPLPPHFLKAFTAK